MISKFYTFIWFIYIYIYIYIYSHVNKQILEKKTFWILSIIYPAFILNNHLCSLDATMRGIILRRVDHPPRHKVTYPGMWNSYISIPFFGTSYTLWLIEWVIPVIFSSFQYTASLWSINSRTIQIYFRDIFTVIWIDNDQRCRLRRIC